MSLSQYSGELNSPEPLACFNNTDVVTVLHVILQDLLVTIINNNKQRLHYHLLFTHTLTHSLLMSLDDQQL